MSYFLCQTAVKFNFSDKIYVGDHLERFESVEERTGKGERGQERKFARLCVLHVLISDPNISKNVHFWRQKEKKNRLFRQNVCRRPLRSNCKCRNKFREERERGRNRKFARLSVFHALISDPNNSKNVIFLCQKGIKFDFSDKIYVGDH